MVEATGHSRFRLSIRTLMIAVALCAVLLAPAVWETARKRMPAFIASRKTCALSSAAGWRFRRVRGAVLIPPGVRHRAAGRMTILRVVLPSFEPADKWLH